MTDNITEIYDCVIIGAGASGLFCAATMDTKPGGRYLILERTDRAGTKLLMSGGGHCNITHTGEMKDFVAKYGAAGRGIRKCLYKHSNILLIDFLGENGIETESHADGRVFPISMHAEDIRQMLLRRAKGNGFDIRYGSAVTAIRDSADGLSVSTDNMEYNARAIVIATGGCSYPASGSDGSFFDIIKRDLGVNVTPLAPALGSIKILEYPYEDLSGISFENVHATIRDASNGGKTKAAQCGALLFTHANFSGPAILDLSKHAKPGDTISINYAYPLDREQVFDKIRAADEGSKKDLATTLAAEFSLPKRFCRVIADRSGSSLRNAASLIADDTFEITGVAGFESAMVTSGGIELSQVDMKTMMLKDHPGIYAIGEALDVDGVSGGYNLQFAYSSARAACDSI